MINRVINFLTDRRKERDKTINILMVGASGVGKTSTLTAMYDRFQKIISKDLELQLIPDDATAEKLNNKLVQLKKQIATEFIRTRPTLAGTKTFEEFHFKIVKSEKGEEEINLTFKDFPGGYLYEERDKIKEWLKEADVILIPIDTPSLIEAGGEYNEQANSPEKLFDIFDSIRGSFALKNRLVLFVPLKSEKYLDGKLYFTNPIRDRIEQEFHKLIELFSSEEIKERVALAITTIQTIGGIRFSMIEIDSKGRPIFIYKKKGFQAQYSPLDTEQPLKYILTFAISEVLKKRGKVNRFLSDVLDWDTPFVKTIKEFSKDYKQDHNFVILQGEELLKPEKWHL